MSDKPLVEVVPVKGQGWPAVVVLPGLSFVADLHDIRLKEGDEEGEEFGRTWGRPTRGGRRGRE